MLDHPTSTFSGFAVNHVYMKRLLSARNRLQQNLRTTIRA
jgi:hypothetical protein